MLGIYMDSGMIIPELLYNSWNNQPYRSIEEAVELLTTGQRIGCALSPHYSIHSTSESDNLRIAREGLWIGSYIPELNQVWLNNQNLIGYFEELSELGFDVNKEDFEQDQPPVFQAVDNGLHNITIEDIVTQTHTLNSVWESETEAQLDFSLESMMEA
jgi:hypothetical protein